MLVCVLQPLLSNVVFEMIAVIAKNQSHDEDICELLLIIRNVMHYNNLSVAIRSIQCYSVFTMIVCITHPIPNTHLSNVADHKKCYEK